MSISNIDNSKADDGELLSSFSIQAENNNISHNIEKSSIIGNATYRDIYIRSIGLFFSSNIFYIAKEVFTSMIPIYGSIQAFKKGNTLYGLFGIIADILTLIHIMALGDKLEGFLIQGCKAIVSSIVLVAEIISGRNDILTEVDNLTIAESSTANTTATNEPTWHKLSVVDNLHLYKLSRCFFYEFRMLESDKVYKQLFDASKASEFIVNGQNIISDNLDGILHNLRKIFPNDFKQIQLISAFAHEGIFDKPFTHKIPPIDPSNHFRYVATNGKTSYKINTLANGKLAFIAKYESKFVQADGSPNINYNNFGVKVSTIISTNTIPEFNYSYYYN
ncbi:MAG: hypothetical protein C4617_00555 [Candidatus Liberibacter europaeus]|uniref:Uncharacterized protein n=1 Tax=Candidatus Liberibacter europaeus TaxID=744859 RepID=A0A2T4VYV0_9HYPH|nr:hypothetical protein [Candidatus Liberibacter europaeus]PTL86945.1 MAG: hypothetical protein C4617_00555 [Candidatus Liberibacter europaeus]